MVGKTKSASKKSSTPPARPSRQPATPKADEIAVRMYRQGLGDCFLLTFPGRERPVYMLIDCGLMLGTEKQLEKMQAVAEDIRATTGGRLDVVIATHEHWDHLSGFIQAKEVFEKIEIGELWLAWTEDPDNELAQKLRRERKAAFAALQRAASRLQAAGSPKASALMNLLEFAGPLGAKPSATTEAALAFIRTRVDRPRFCYPGREPFSLPGVDGVHIYVLGPPENEQLLKKGDPTKRGKEVYELTFATEFTRAFIAALDTAEEPFENLTIDQRRDYELSLPFDRSLQLSIEAAKQEAFFRNRYGFPSDPPMVPPYADELSWRRIDTDWLEMAGSLALKLDNDTNNTCLAIAIELTATGKVLLFPGDAQVGNWLSWADLCWPKDAKPEDSNAITAAHLLARTVLYKVGHHASHNATLREKGLELMISGELVALIPVDEDIARNKKHWDMPFPALLKRLEQKTKGRIIRADCTVSDLKKSPNPNHISPAEWNAFLDKISADQNDELYVEYRISV
ncbi:MBL fold metallo-hydrolase [Methylocaldum sp.]|uniref:MBL fold metallo-hydrolase n=1 Tax=Methylocaldum sp. TaxID=1969727 RepID=UPI002D704C73|nr:MBL fold metallo-hydrolase [Methylocaldum sp.]HYE33988.1 MBL fold metallo-hydrolase [Methylocaldum sp.]